MAAVHVYSIISGVGVQILAEQTIACEVEGFS
jgi:hypothetical protein